MTDPKNLADQSAQKERKEREALATSAPRARVPRILSVAGTDPTGGAGIQADLKSIAANGGYGMSVVTALVAQNTQGVRSIHVPPANFLRQQLDAVSDDVQIDGVKIGMLVNAEYIETVAQWLRDTRPPRMVLDPVMVATSGDSLLRSDAQDAMIDLLSLVDVVTPNLPELAALLNRAVAITWTEVLEQARLLSMERDVLVVAKGGHLAGNLVPDALVDASQSPSRVAEFITERVDTVNTHGTGCSLSAAIVTRWAASGDLTAAIADSKAWLTESIQHGDSLAVGQGRGPISHFAGLWLRAGMHTASDDVTSS